MTDIGSASTYAEKWADAINETYEEVQDDPVYWTLPCLGLLVGPHQAGAPNDEND